MRHNLRHIKSRVPKSPLFETVEGKIWFFECHLILKIHYHLLLKITIALDQSIIVTLIFIEFGSLDHNMGASKRDTLAANLNKKGFF